MEKNSNEQIIHQPIYKRRKDRYPRLSRSRHQSRSTTHSRHFTVIQPKNAVGAQSITYSSNNTVQRNRGFVRDRRTYGLSEKSNLSIYPNIDKTYNSNRNFRSRNASLSRFVQDDSFGNSNFSSNQRFCARAKSCVRESVTYSKENNAFFERRNRSRSSKKFILLNNFVLIILRIK